MFTPIVVMVVLGKSMNMIIRNGNRRRIGHIKLGILERRGLMDNFTTLMAAMVILFILMVITRLLIRGYRRKVGLSRLIIIASIGAFFIGTIYMFWIV